MTQVNTSKANIFHSSFHAFTELQREVAPSGQSFSFPQQVSDLSDVALLMVRVTDSRGRVTNIRILEEPQTTTGVAETTSIGTELAPSRELEPSGESEDIEIVTMAGFFHTEDVVSMITVVETESIPALDGNSPFGESVRNKTLVFVSHLGQTIDVSNLYL